jgi:predicted DNA-binding protein YlxM (UPF0122 family)
LDDVVGTNTTLLIENGRNLVVLDRQKPLSEREAALEKDAKDIANLANSTKEEHSLSPFEHNLKMYNESGVKQNVIEQISGGELEFAEEIVALAKSITEGINGDRAKAKAIHLWIAGNLWYNSDWFDSKIEPIFTAPLDVLKFRYTICDGYARLNAALLGAVGIPAVYATGDPVGRGQSHAWNEIYLDGEWVITNVTWDSNNDYGDANFSEMHPGGEKEFDVTLEEISKEFRLRGYSIIEVLEPTDKSDPLNSASSWARTGITDAIGKGFVPDHLKNKYTSVITRKEFCYMAIRWLMYVRDEGMYEIVGGSGLAGYNFKDTTDVYIRGAYALGVTSGTGGGNFTPNGTFTREQAATMIMNTCKAAGIDVSNTASAGFTDISEASSWAVDAINFVRNAGIMGGVGGDRFDPKATYTREQSILTFNNIPMPETLPKGDPNPAYQYRVIGNTVTILGYLGENYTGDSDTEVVIPSTIEGRPVTVIGERAFDSHKNLTTVTLPDTVTTIDSLAFAGCIKLSKINIPSGVTTIGQAAFSRCENLTAITIPSGVKTIGDTAFMDCTKLTSITIPGSVMSIGLQAFYNCPSLSSLTLMDGITSIGVNAFRQCESITTVTIPKSVTAISQAAFYDCPRLSSAYFEGNAPEMDTYVFDKCAPDFTVYYRAGTSGWSNPWNGYKTATW